MATIYLPDDHGDAITVDGVAYHRIGQVVHEVTHTPTGEDMLNIGEQAFSNPVTYGTVSDSPWTACQHAVSMFPEHYSEDITCTVPEGTAEGAVVETLFTAPANGEVLIFSSPAGSEYYYVDGVYIGSAGTSQVFYQIRLLGGQVLAYGQSQSVTGGRSWEINWMKFRPDQYPGS